MLIAFRTVVAVTAAGFALERLKIPAGALIGAMLAAMIINLAGAEVRKLPDWGRFVSYVAIGWLLGQGFTRETLATVRASIVPLVAILGTLLAIAVVLVLVLKVMGIDPATAFLAASPAGITQMAALSTDMSADASLVVTAHLIRTIAVVALAPLVVRLMS